MEIKGLQIVPEPIIQQPKTNHKNKNNIAGDNFQKILIQELQAESRVQISHHAQKRLQQRNIELNSKDLQNIAQAMNQAETKGVKESLLIYGDLAMVASIKNRTIVTALSGLERDNKVFTNIDGAIVIKKQ